MLSLPSLVLPRTHRAKNASRRLTSQRNMGLMLAVTDGVLPGVTEAYFALSLCTIYLSPQLLRPMANRVVVREHNPAGGA
jgi:hypothetical protein